MPGRPRGLPSRNLTTHFEMHGEAAVVTDVRKAVVGPDGAVTVDEEDAWSVLAGIRYLASTDTTWIFEYYHNGNGYTEGEAQDPFDFVATADDGQLAGARRSLLGCQRPHFMRNYLCTRRPPRKSPSGGST